MKKLITSIILLCITSIAQANDSYVIDAKIYDNTNLIGSPTLITLPNEVASITVDNAYSLTLTLLPIEAPAISITAELEVGGERLTPMMIVEPGVEASMEVGDKKLSILVNKSDCE